MEWYTLFRQPILDRGIQYYEEGCDSDFVYSNNGISMKECFVKRHQIES